MRPATALRRSRLCSSQAAQSRPFQAKHRCGAAPGRTDKLPEDETAKGPKFDHAGQLARLV
jgi:hypothetical protein